MPVNDLRDQLRSRLRAIQAELNRSDAQMGELLGVGRTRWGQWVGTAGNKPAEEAMIRLCEAASVTMEWLYRGKPDGMPARLAIRLQLRLSGVDPDVATAQERAVVAQRIAEGVS